MRVIGIDPGKTGAFALLDPVDGLDIVDMPMLDNRINKHELRRQIIEWGRVDLVALEEPILMPGRSAGILTSGINWGTLDALLFAFDRPVIYVRSQTWTKWHLCGADKDVHRAAAMRRFPAHAELFNRKKDDGRADAALIAAWCADTHSGGVAA